MCVQYVDITQTVCRTGTTSVYIVLEYIGRKSDFRSPWCHSLYFRSSHGVEVTPVQYGI